MNEELSLECKENKDFIKNHFTQEKKFKFDKKLGEGGYGIVYLVECKETSETKKVKKSQ